jgi:hypothetical protein
VSAFAKNYQLGGNLLLNIAMSKELVLVLVVVLVLENPDVWQSGQRNKIIAGQSGSFRCSKRRFIVDGHDDEKRTRPKFEIAVVRCSHEIAPEPPEK